MTGNKLASDKTENCAGVLIDILPTTMRQVPWRFNLPKLLPPFQFSSLSCLCTTLTVARKRSIESIKSSINSFAYAYLVTRNVVDFML